MKKRILGSIITIVGLALIVAGMYIQEIKCAQFSVFILMIGAYLFFDK